MFLVFYSVNKKLHIPLYLGGIKESLFHKFQRALKLKKRIPTTLIIINTAQM